MKRIFSLCMVIALLLCCFAGCQPQEKPLTEEEKALKELQDAWNAVVVERTETVNRVLYYPGSASSLHYNNQDSGEIAELLELLKNIKPENFQLSVSKENEPYFFDGWITLWTNDDLNYDMEAYEKGETIRPLTIRFAENGRLCIQLTAKTPVYACCPEEIIQTDALRELIRSQKFDVGLGDFSLFMM